MAKKEKPQACACRKCLREPAIVKIRPGYYRVACPYLDCESYDSTLGSTEAEAIEAWNNINEKEAEQ